MRTPPTLENRATPYLLIDLEVAEANARVMADALRNRGISLRPHVKTHKSTSLARIQRVLGADGITVATIGEAEVFIAAGFDDIFIARPLWITADAAAKLDQLTLSANLRIGVDSRRGVQSLAEQLQRRESIEVMVEIDSGQHRTGVHPSQAGPLALHCQSLGLRIAGVFTHGGHSYAGPGAVSRAAADESEALETASRSLEDHGIAATVLSAGSSPTALELGGGVTEARPGTYLLNDRQQIALGAARLDQVAAVVATRVISTAVPGQFVVDAGSKALTAESSSLVEGYGFVRELDGAVVTRVSEHHGIISYQGTPPPEGTLLHVVPNHICTVVNLYDQFITQASDPITIDARGHLT
ncbi:alanine racemase [Ferrimicrobium sp.]|uniref:alanine racemase n=1 Tax=Ferrimicrobium sp. TaxID=2926050 RepID=UPI002623EF5D|nr:alanine racemase [Ferrimicrobium sp.]